MALEIVLRQIAVLAILVLLGLAASRAKVITTASKDVLARIIFYITLPALLFTNFSKIDLTPELLSGSLQTLLLSLFVLLFMLLVGIVTSKLAGLKGSQESIFRLHSMLGNIIYLGLPLVSSQYGREGLLYASLFILVSNILMWTVGVAIITPGARMGLGRNLIKLFNINTIAIISGFCVVSSVCQATADHTRFGRCTGEYNHLFINDIYRCGALFCRCREDGPEQECLPVVAQQAADCSVHDYRDICSFELPLPRAPQEGGAAGDGYAGCHAMHGECGDHGQYTWK